MIRPRKPVKLPPLPVLAVSMIDQESTFAGELFPLSELRNRLAERVGHWPTKHPQIPPAIVATDDPGALLAHLDKRFRRHGEPNFELWQYRLALRPATAWLGAVHSPYDALSPSLAWFGWSARRGTLKRAQGRSRYYPVLDCFAWTQASEILENYPGLLVEQMARFAGDLQAFCIEQQLPLALTAAGIAGQLLKDPRFWPRERRKIPAATNARARAQLPGNHYRLALPRPAGDSEKPVRVRGRVLELDMTGAHHRAAMMIRPPASDELYAWGRYYETPTRRPRGRLIPLERIPREHGLLLVAVEVAPGVRFDPLAHPALDFVGLRWRYLWTPELDLLDRTPGVTIHGAAAGWTAAQVDEGLCEYALWARGQLLAADRWRRPWLKQALLAAYGLLASKPREYVSMFRWAHGEQMAVTFTGGQVLHGVRRRTATVEPQTSNVIWRGMIEAWVRAETLAYAQQLRAHGWQVVSVYADALYVIAREDRQPPARQGWRVAQTLHGLRFLSPTHFRSDEVDKLPGIPRTRRAA